MASIDEVARHIGLSSREVDRLISAKVFPRRARGEHDLDECRNLYIRHLRVAVVRKALEHKPHGLEAFNELLESATV